ncbi:thiamine phosphate synthase [Candidatus Pelagibacter sp.]|nr:thiamine phosphate synthase [Candidatus Pelagibacter sp.]
MRFNKKKFIYLISPPKIERNFFKDLNEVFKQKKTSFFQLRLKKNSFKKKLIIGRKIQKICKRFKVKFLINDDVYLARKLNADGCHLGQKDMKIKEARKLIGKKIIGITCHNSIKLAKTAIKNKADYLAFGAFNSSKTKKVKYKASIGLLKKAKKITNTPIVVIGGINFNNYKNLLLNKANFLAISGYIWKNKKLKPKNAIKKLI